MRWLRIFGTAFLVLFLDQIAKRQVTASLLPQEGIPLTGFFNLVHVRNRGAAFGFLNNPDTSWQFWLFCAAALLALGIVLLAARSARETETALFHALGGISGGALGNLVDRIRFREVIDFLDLHYAGWHWPAFNIADMGIFFGALFTARFLLRPDASATPPDKRRQRRAP